MAVDCIGEWTDWIDQRFYGESVIQCIAKAAAAKSEWTDKAALETRP